MFAKSVKKILTLTLTQFALRRCMVKNGGVNFVNLKTAFVCLAVLLIMMPLVPAPIFGSYAQVANFTSNFSGKQNSTFEYMYVNRSGTYFDMTFSQAGTCSTGTSCWSGAGDNALSIANYTSNNLSVSVSPTGDAVFRFILPQGGNYTVNGTFWTRVGFTGENLNMSVALNKTYTNTVCGLNFSNASGGNTNFNCVIGNLLQNGQTVDFIIGENGQADGGRNNFTTVIYAEQTQDFFQISAYDEQSLISLNFSATVTNATNSTTISNVVNYTAPSSSLPTGNITVVMSATNYNSRTFLAFNNVSAEGYQNVTGYLLNSTNSVANYYTVVNPNNVGIVGALVNITRTVNNIVLPIAQIVTVGGGSTGQVFLLGSATYAITISAAGFITTSTSTTGSSCTANCPFTLLTTANNTVGFYQAGNGISWLLQPIGNLLRTFPNSTALQNVNFSFTLNATNATAALSNWGFNLTLANGTLVSTNASSAAQGGVLSNIVNVSRFVNNNTVLNATLWFNMSSVTGGDFEVYTQLYSLNNYTETNASLSVALTELAAEDKPTFGTALLIIAVAGATLFSGLGGAAGAAIAAIILILGTVAGIFPAYITVLSLLSAISVYFWRRPS